MLVFFGFPCYTGDIASEWRLLSVGALEEIIRHGETGFLVEEGERAHAAALVDDLFDIPRACCRALVELNFALDEMIDAYERVYREAIKENL